MATTNTVCIVVCTVSFNIDCFKQSSYSKILYVIIMTVQSIMVSVKGVPKSFRTLFIITVM